MTEFLLGTAVEGGEAPHVRPDNAQQPLQKPCRAPRGVAVAAGDRVLLLKYGGAFLIVAVYP